MADEIDYKIIERQLAILMTNSVAFSSKLYDLFVSTTPMDIEVNVWTSVDTFETITIPNRAKGNIPASYGYGTPEGDIEASYGSIYLDREDGSIYIKTTLDGSLGWLKLITEADMDIHNKSKSSHDGTLAKIDGAYANGTANTFIVADAVEDVPHESEELTDEYYAINKGSLFKLLGGLENLETDDKTTIVNAINEVASSVNYDACCVVSGAKHTFTNNSAYLTIVTDESNKKSLKVITPIIVTAPSGKKYTVATALQQDLEGAGVLNDVNYSIYLNIDDMKLVILAGEFYKQSTRPFVLSEKDGWLDTSSSPYRFFIIEQNEIGSLIEVEKNYVYLGKLEQWGDE